MIRPLSYEAKVKLMAYMPVTSEISVQPDDPLSRHGEARMCRTEA